MTDVLDDMESMLSTQEVAPVAAPTPAGEGLVKTCPECGATKTQNGLPFLTNGQLGAHRARAHGYVSEDPKAVAERERKAGTARKPLGRPVGSTNKTASTSRARKPLGESLARIFLQVGRIVNTILDPPTGAAIMFEAGALGVAVDTAIAGTIIDKPLQKGAAVAEKFEPLVSLVTMPAMVFMLSRNPNLQPVIEGELREALEDVLVQSLPLFRRRAARTKATVDALAELRQISPELAQSDDPIRDILDSFFSPVAPDPVEVPEP